MEILTHDDTCLGGIINGTGPASGERPRCGPSLAAGQADAGCSSDWDHSTRSQPNVVPHPKLAQRKPIPDLRSPPVAGTRPVPGTEPLGPNHWDRTKVPGTERGVPRQRVASHFDARCFETWGRSNLDSTRSRDQLQKMPPPCLQSWCLAPNAVAPNVVRAPTGICGRLPSEIPRV